VDKNKKAEAAKKCLEFNKDLKAVHVTDDLECFASKNDAVNHARTLVNKEIEVFERDEEGAAVKPIPALDLIKMISEANTVEEIVALLPEGESRKTVLAAVEAREKELTAE